MLTVILLRLAAQSIACRPRIAILLYALGFYLARCTFATSAAIADVNLVRSADWAYRLHVLLRALRLLNQISYGCSQISYGYYFCDVTG